MYEESIEREIQGLPEDLRRQVLDYIEFLSNKYASKHASAKKFRFDWEGGLSKIREEFTSVEFQHKASEWR